MGETLERIPAAAHQCNGIGFRAHITELVDVGTGNEAIRFPRCNDEARRGLEIEPIERDLELVKHRP